VDEGVAECKEAVRLKPDFAEGHSQLAYVLAMKGDVDGAIAECKEALRLKPDLVEARCQLGSALAMKGDMETAVAEYEKAIRSRPDRAASHDDFGAVLLGKGDIDRAIAEFREAIRLKPDMAEAHLKLGTTLMHKGDMDGALAAARQAVRLKPEWAEAHCNLGSVLKDKGDLAGAMAESREAIRLQPEFGTAHYNLACYLSLKGQTQAALQSLRKAIELDPTCKESAAKDTDFDPIRNNPEFKQAIRLDLGAAEAHFKLAQALMEKGDLASAYYHLACDYSLKAKTPDALESLQKAIQLDPTCRGNAAKDADFDPIRNNPEFKRLIAEPATIATQQDLGTFLMTYYMQPRPDLVCAAIQVMGSSGTLKNAAAVPPMVAFFGEIFAANPAMLPQWQGVIEKQDKDTKEALERALSLGKKPGAVLKMEGHSAELNDMCWGAFFASGNAEYIRRLIKELDCFDERKDLRLFLVGATAKWSLASNAVRHYKVRLILETARANSQGRVKELINDALTQDPGKIKEEYVEIIKRPWKPGK
jgi:tetratricopeptide (TPR) repeat protein